MWSLAEYTCLLNIHTLNVYLYTVYSPSFAGGPEKLSVLAKKGGLALLEFLGGSE